MADLYSFSTIAAAYAVVELIAIGLAADAIMQPRSSQAAIAWSISLITLPIVTIPLYLVLGRRRFHGYASALRDIDGQVGEHLSDWLSRMSAVAATPQKDLRAIEGLVQNVTNIPFTKSNGCTLLLGGEATYAAMQNAIADAHSYVLVQFYIVNEGRVASRIRDALVERARTGIRVYFLYDEIGSWKLSTDYLEALRDANIHVSGFKTTQGSHNRFQINFRNHRKLLVVDGRIGFIGGHNLGDEYLNYRDTHLRIDGPAALEIQFSFLKDWYWATRQIPEINTTIQPSLAENKSVAVVATGPADDRPRCGALFATAAHLAKQRFWITSPYFVPDDVMVRALQAAAMRGVDVRILLPARADNRLVELASFTYYDEMLSCGVKLYRYQGDFLHQKVFLVDHDLAAVGTVNLDNRSLYLNFEATALVADAGFADQVVAMLESDLARSAMVDRAHFSNKPVWFRVAARVARLASPLL